MNNFSKETIYKNIDIYKLLYPNPESANKNTFKNIHFVVLESFIDPRLLKNVQFDVSPLSHELSPFLLGGEKFSLLKSPVYGGRTAQAEFELLTGVRALAKVDSIEFNVMMGKPANGFIKRLTDSGYKAIATIASGSGYFNSKQAYKSIGFNKVTFLKELNEFASDKSYLPIFDGDLFRYNLELVKKLVKNHEKHLFNYVLGMYGHFPYETASEKYPDVIKVTHEDDRVRKISNQFFYRTKAIANYISQLRSIDPDSIICITSDHLPPILWDGTQYQLEQYTNSAIFIDSGKVIDISGKEYFQIPWMIWKMVSRGKDNIKIDESQMESIYFKFLSESMYR
jgi:phosphoglycerol transferase MdoB-like AlkP superfamily enzyme